MDIRDALRWGRDELGAGRGSGLWRDAEILLEGAAGKRRYELFLNGSDRLTDAVLGKYREYIFKRRERVPVAYILGWAEFMSLPFRTDRRALIPRPETEILLERALGVLDKGSTVLDVGTGSGNIAVSAAFHSGCRVCASDISGEALGLARENAAVNGVQGRVEFFEGDMFQPFKERDLKGFDLVMSNPPYVRTGDLKSLQGEIRMYEPRLALDGGIDGLSFYGRLADEAPGFLNEGGAVILETGWGQGEAVAGMLGERGFSVRLLKDYSGVYRAVEGVMDG